MKSIQTFVLVVSDCMKTYSYLFMINKLKQNLMKQGFGSNQTFTNEFYHFKMLEVQFMKTSQILQFILFQVFSHESSAKLFLIGAC